MQKKYRVRERAHPELLHDLMLARGVAGEAAQAEFLDPSFERDSHDPMLLPDMEKAVDRIIAANKQGEKICVWSDYDCDGIPGGSLLSDFFMKIEYPARLQVAERNEGYGLNKPGIKMLADEGITDAHAIAQAIRRVVGRWVAEKYRRRPMIVPTVLEVE